MLTNLQDKIFTSDAPVEIDKACEDIRVLLSGLSWVSHPFHIAQRFYRKVGDKVFYYPETYVPNTSQFSNDKNKSYHPLTPDNDYSGMFFFMVGAGRMDDDDFITYQTSIIFSVNLALIDGDKLKRGLFTQELIRDARKQLIDNIDNFDYEVKFQTETRDLRDVYREFVLDEIEQYNRAPLQCFRFDLTIKIEQEC